MAEYVFKLDKIKACYSDAYSEHGNCPFHYYEIRIGSDLCSLSNCKCLKTKRPKDCPLKELSSHGDLVDRKDVLDAMNEEIVPKGVFLSDIYKALDIVPIVIGASTDTEASKERE